MKAEQITLGVNVQRCKECENMNYAMRVMKALQFRRSNANIGIGKNLILDQH